MTDDANVVRLTMVLTDDVVNDVVVVILVAVAVDDSFAFDKFSDHNQLDLVSTGVVTSYVNLNCRHSLEIVVVFAWNIAIEGLDTVAKWNSAAV